MTLRSDTGRPIVYLHIGAMKTGTTYLQQLLYANRDQLAAAGLVLPGDSWGRQVRGVQDVMRLGRRDRHIRRHSAGAWQALVDEALSAPGKVSLISVEFLSFAGRRRARQIVETLEPADIHVVLTVRDMTASLPSQWQTLVHNGLVRSWPDFLRSVPQPTSRPAEVVGRLRRHAAEFHRTQNVARMLANWEPWLSPGRLHVVTVPRNPARPDELWLRFASVIGVDPSIARRPPKDTNPSLGHASTELVRRLNGRLGALPESEYNWTVKEPVALRVLARRARFESKAQLTPDAYDLALRWNRLIRDAVVERGVPVTGDLGDLPVEGDTHVRQSLPDTPPAPPDWAILDAAEVAARAFARQARRRRRKLDRAGVAVELAGRRPVGELRSEWEAAQDPVDAAARELADRARESAMLLRRIRDQRYRSAGA